MSIYIIEVLCMVGLYPLFHKTKFKSNKYYLEGNQVYLLIIFWILAIIMSFRAPNIGTDTGTYYRMYNDICNTNSLMEAINVSRITAPVYVLYAFLLSRIISISQAITMMNALIACIGMYLFIKKTSVNYLYSVLLYICLPLYFESMNGTRQFMAMAIGLNAYIILIKSMKNIKGWILLIIAIGVHNTSILLLLSIASIYIVKKIKDNRKIFKISLICSIAINIAFQFLMQIIIYFFPYYSMYLDGRNTAQINAASGGGRIVFLYIILFISIVIIVYVNKNGVVDEAVNKSAFISYMIPSVTFCVIIGIFNAKSNLINRLLWYFLNMFIIFIPNGYQKVKTKERIVIMLATIGAISVYGMVHLIEDKSGIVPYLFFWN